MASMRGYLLSLCVQTLLPEGTELSLVGDWMGCELPVIVGIRLVVEESCAHGTDLRRSSPSGRDG